MTTPVFMDLLPSLPLAGALVGLLVAETEDMLVGLLKLAPDVDVAEDVAEVVSIVAELMRFAVSIGLVKAGVLESWDIEVEVAVDLGVAWEDEVIESSSGHTPVVHGSLEQHPVKGPTLQTYHCLPPVQVWSRGESESIAEDAVRRVRLGQRRVRLEKSKRAMPPISSKKSLSMEVSGKRAKTQLQPHLGNEYRVLRLV